MNQLKCEMCGSTDLVKQDGMFVCQVCGTKYSVEEAKKMMIEGTVEVAGTVKVDTSTAIVRARQSLSHGEMKNAKEYFDRVLEADPTNAEAWWGKFLIDFEVTDENALFNNPDLYLFRQIENNSNYREALQYAKEPFLARINRFRAEMKNHGEIARENEGKACFEIEDGRLNKVTSAASVRYKDLIIPEGVTSIKEFAFDGFKFNSVTFPKSLTEIEGRLFCERGGTKEVRISDLAAWCKIDFGYNPIEDAKRFVVNGKEVVADLEIPAGVTIINGAFSGLKKLKNVSIPNSVTEIGDNAFTGCEGLTSITIPNSVTKIGFGAFSCCGLTSITIPNSVTEIGEYAFEYCGLTKIIIPGNIKSISKGMFANCSNLTDVTICEGVKTIEDRAFSDCGNLRRIIIPKSVTSISSSSPTQACNRAFFRCENLEEVTIPKSFAGLFNSKLKNIFDWPSKIKFHLI